MLKRIKALFEPLKKAYLQVKALVIEINNRNLMWFWVKMVFATMLARSYAIEHLYYYMKEVSPGSFDSDKFYSLSDGLASFAVFAAVKAAYSQRHIKTKMAMDFLLAAIAADFISRLLGVVSFERADVFIPFFVFFNFLVYGKQRRVVRLVLYKSYKVVSLYYSDFKHMIKG